MLTTSGARIQVHGWVYDLSTGLIKDLHVGQSLEWREIRDIYQLNYNQVVDLEPVAPHSISARDPVQFFNAASAPWSPPAAPASCAQGHRDDSAIGK